VWGPSDEKAQPPAARRAYVPAASAAGGLVLASPVPAARAAPATAAPPRTAPPAPTPAPPPTPTGPDVVDRLERLADLRERGLLDEQEDERVKAKILREEVES
jgi:hypothetical protein